VHGKVAALILVIPLLIRGQTPACHVSFSSSPDNSRNIFSPDQEVDLGDAIAESTLLDMRVLAENDPTLQRIATRLAAAAPLRGLQIRTFIVEVPQASALVTPGGRVYVSLALIRLAQSEDEVAGMISHEFGHLLAHQYAIRVSRLMKSTMGVTEVHDRRDIFEKYHRLLESLWIKPHPVTPYDVTHAPAVDRGDEMEADRLGLQIQAAAGYDPMAPIHVFDRLAETHGKTGNFFSNFFNFTPDEDRLGRMLKFIPGGCQPAAKPAAEFLQWREQIQANTRVQYPEVLHGVQSRHRLKPELVGQLRQIRFSRDGRLILAQDVSGITILAARPLALLFRIPAENAGRADFTPDARDIVFLRSGTRLERWSIAGRKLTSYSYIPLRDPCLAERSSPDGRYLVCVDPEWTLRVIDAATAEPVFEKKNFAASWEYESLNSFRQLFMVPGDIGIMQASMLDFPRDDRSFIVASHDDLLMRLHVVGLWQEKATIDFTPNSRFLLAAPNRYPGSAVAWDLERKTETHLGGLLTKLHDHYFAFTADDRVFVSQDAWQVNNRPSVDARLVGFPSGEEIARIAVPPGPVERTTQTGAVLVRPTPPRHGLTAPGFQPSTLPAAEVFEVPSGKVLAEGNAEFDILGDTYLSDNAAGEAQLRDRSTKQVRASAQLPGGDLPPLRAIAVSGDFSRLLISTAARAGVWDLNTGAALMRFGPVNGGFFDVSNHLLADVPGTAAQHRSMVEVDPVSRQVARGPEIPSKLARQSGPYLYVLRRKDGTESPFFDPENGTFHDVTFETFDARSMNLKWSRTFSSEAPVFYPDPNGRHGLFIWRGNSSRVQHDADLRSRLTALDKNATRAKPLCDYPVVVSLGGPLPTYLLKLAETINMENGESEGHILFDPGDPCMLIREAFSIGHAVAIEDQHNRVVTYNADNDQPRLRAFGHLLAGDPVRARVAVLKEPAHLVIYDAQTGDQKDEFHFPSPVAFARFRSDGLALMVVTASQEVFALAVN